MHSGNLASSSEKRGARGGILRVYNVDNGRFRDALTLIKDVQDKARKRTTRKAVEGGSRSDGLKGAVAGTIFQFDAGQLQLGIRQSHKKPDHQ